LVCDIVVAGSIRSLAAKIEGAIVKANSDNSLVYFQDIPNDVDRPPLAPGATIMTRKTLDVTAMEQVPIVLFFRVDVNVMASTGAAPPPAPAT
jgi:hypothetical protein